VLATVLAAVFGYRAIVVKDGLCSSVDQGHDALLNLYSRHFDIQVELALADELLEAWRS
jgi:nicotinamidase-related amidase